MLRLRELRHRYGGRVVLDIPDFTLGPGTVTTLVGPNGSGKSTLLRILAAIEQPHEGTLEAEGRPIRTSAERQTVRRVVTLVEQHPLLFDMTVAGNLRDALQLHGEPTAGAEARIADALDAVGAGPLADRRARTLSGGETQRVAIARALLLAPRDYEQAMANLRRHGIGVFGTFVFGYERDTPATIARALAFAQEQGFYLAAFNHLVPFPGTPLYRRLTRENRLLKPQWWLDPQYRFNEVAFRPAAMDPAELSQSCLAARKTFLLSTPHLAATP